MPSERRRLIVNADDFGLSPGVNAGIVRARRAGVLTSATLLANAPFFAEAVRLAVACPDLGVGLHLNLVRGVPLSPVGEIPDLVDAGGRLRRFRLRRFGAPLLRQAEREYRRQFEKTLAAGIRPTHIDFEKHHAWQRPLYALACRLAAEYGVPAVRTLSEPVCWAVARLGWPGWRRAAMAAALRAGVTLLGGGNGRLTRPERLLGQSHIGGMDEAVWLRLIASLPPGDTEVMTHPGEAEPEALPGGAASDMGGSWLSRARPVELAALLSPAVRRAMTTCGVELITYRELSPGDD